MSGTRWGPSGVSNGGELEPAVRVLGLNPPVPLLHVLLGLGRRVVADHPQRSLISKFSLKIAEFFAVFFFFFFSGAGGWRSAPKRPRMPGRKGNTEKEGGQAAAKKRSPLHRMWKHERARSAKVHACVGHK